MVETPAQPPHVAEFALLAGFILLIVLEVLLVPAAPRRTTGDVELPRDTPAESQRVVQKAPPLPTPAP
jgi:hypothetical protein